MRPDPTLPTVMPTTNRPINATAAINNDTSRLDGVAKVTGRARYGRDQHLPNAVYGAFIRCPYGNAELESADQEAARAIPGVLEVEVGGKAGTYHGATLGHIAAESLLALRRGLRALNARWKRNPAKIGITDSLNGTPELDAEAAAVLEKAELKLDAVYSTPVQTHSSLETHGACIDHKGDSATVYASTQGTFSFRDGLSDAIGLANSKFEIVAEYVGGGFGSKLGGPGKEGLLAARLGNKYKRPAYVFCDREEEHLDTGNRPSGRALVRIGFNKDGTILGGEIRTWGGTGVGRGGGGMRIPSNRYDLGEIKAGRAFHTDVQSNAGAPRAFRAPGHPQAAFVEELMLDEVAAKCGLDPLVLRKKLDRDADRREMMDLGGRLIGWENRTPNGSQTGVVRRGFGMGTTTWGSRRDERTVAEVVINRDGSVETRTGTQDIGTGQRTTMAILAADRLGIPLAAVTTRIGHSTLPYGPGSGGSTTTPSTAPCMAAAADDAKGKLLGLVAKQAGGEAGEYEIKDGQILRAGKPVMKWADACGKISDSIIGRGTAEAKPFDPDTGHSHGVQFVDLQVDTETGVIRVKRIVAIQACGKPICRKTAESQIIGGVIQGVSFGLFEDRILDRTTGAMVNPNLEWYKVLGTVDMPHIEPVLWTKNQTGARSLGEPPTIPTAGAIGCALFNALGKPVRHLPLTPDKVLAALAGVEGGQA